MVRSLGLGHGPRGHRLHQHPHHVRPSLDEPNTHHPTARASTPAIVVLASGANAPSTSLATNSASTIGEIAIRATNATVRSKRSLKRRGGRGPYGKNVGELASGPLVRCSMDEGLRRLRGHGHDGPLSPQPWVASRSCLRRPESIGPFPGLAECSNHLRRLRPPIDLDAPGSSVADSGRGRTSAWGERPPAGRTTPRLRRS